MKPKAICFLIISVLCAFCHNVAGQQQWPMAGGCKERTSWAADEEQLHPPFNHIISFLPDYNLSYHSLTIFDNIMCAGISGNPNMFYGIDMTTKDTLWSFAVPESGGAVDFSAAQNDMLVFVGGQHGTGLFCLDRYTGEEKWFKPLGSLYTKNAIIDEDRLYILGDSLFCLNAVSGDTVWTHPISGQATPAVDEFNCYITTQRQTYAFNKLTGEIIWKRYNSYYPFGQSLVDESNHYTSSNDSIIARNKTNGELVWAYALIGVELPELETNFMAINGNVLIFSVWANEDTLGQIYVLDKQNGDYLWHYTFEDEGAFSPTLANEVIYIVAWKEHKLYGFDSNTGEVLLKDDSFSYKAIQPVVYNHRIYVVAAGSIVELGNDAPSEINDSPAKDPEIELAVYPNPGVASITVEYTLNTASFVTLSIYNISGAEIGLHAKEFNEPGSYSVSFEPDHLPPGIYLCEARIENAGRKPQKAIHRIKFVVID